MNLSVTLNMTVSLTLNVTDMNLSVTLNMTVSLTLNVTGVTLSVGHGESACADAAAAAEVAAACWELAEVCP
jgi:hypothetical protein